MSHRRLLAGLQCSSVLSSVGLVTIDPSFRLAIDVFRLPHGAAVTDRVPAFGELRCHGSIST